MTTFSQGTPVTLAADFRNLDEVDAFFAAYLEMVRAEFNEKGSYRLRAAVLSSRDNLGVEKDAPCLHIVPDPGGRGTPGEKDLFAGRIAACCEAVEGFAVIFSAETWLAPDQSNAAGKRVLPRDHPARKEALFVSFEHVARPGARAVSAVIHRNADGTPSLGPWIEYPTGLQHRGRFASLLRPLNNRTN